MLKRSTSVAVTLAAPPTPPRSPSLPRHAASYHCKTSTRSVNGAGHQGLWAEVGNAYGAPPVHRITGRVTAADPIAII
ncbi:hypothetical protein ABZY36_02795 [Streptomyces sp. NPDC006627]|uniref:hypothetical protein n=1 Tax=Streptomyces sp. NPDC006627 TaxID=3154679 RepID=UPI0033B8886D